ncbi:MAG: glycosyltransferase family 39 protein [Vicinamibacterales bacterium]
MVLALTVRLHGIDQSLVTFHPTRHYRSAVIARACYYDATPSVAPWARNLADSARSMQPVGEPPFMEWLACQSYRALGHEDIRIPRIIVMLSWIVGAIPLFGLALRLGSVPTAIIAVALYLFMPYSIVATRSFQPDALMTLCTLTAALAVARYFESPVRSRFAAAALLVGVATVVKPMSVFLTLPVLVGMAVARERWRQALTDPRFAGLVLLGFLPATLYYGYGALFGSLARDQMRMRFVPALLTSSFFWHGWLTQIRRVFGLPLFALSLLAPAVAPRRGARVLIAGLWLGYAAFAVAFTYHMPTHDYYHLPYVAVVALGVAATLERLHPWIARHLKPATLLAATCTLTAIMAGWGTLQAWPRLTNARAEATVAAYQRIGELTQHDPNVLFLDLEYGYSLMYHGQVAGDSWPNTDDLAAERLGGDTPISAQDRFERDYAKGKPTYFVVTDLSSLREEADLRALLDQRVTVVEQAPTYHVYKFKTE